jgi:hypothetical protein
MEVAFLSMTANVSGLRAGGELGAITEQFTKILLALIIFP